MKNWQSSPSLPSPEQQQGLIKWCRMNLFSSVVNTLLTLTGLLILWWLIPPFFQWAVVNSCWTGDSREVCDAAFAASGKTGACWVFIKVRLGMFMYGFYPEVERWRINFVLLVLALGLLPVLAYGIFSKNLRQAIFGVFGLLTVFYFFGIIPAIFTAAFFFLPFLLDFLSARLAWLAVSLDLWHTLIKLCLMLLVGALTFFLAVTFIGEGHGWASTLATVVLLLVLFFVRNVTVFAWRWILLFTIFPLFAFYMLVGNVFSLAHVETHYWGGFFLTLVVASSGMATALPIGILMALGRRSELPVIKVVCVVFIEIARSVPLVSVLFMASVMFPLFLPESVTFNKLLRALVGIAFFYAAYMAEVVRGGLQAIPKGQYEAAKALGWPYWRMMAVVILPQTLRLVIPGLAINFLSLLKDTTLVAVIGLLDLLGIAKASMADAEWLGFTKEAYVFAGIVFWVFCFAISRYSVRLEKKLHTSLH